MHTNWLLEMKKYLIDRVFFLAFSATLFHRKGGGGGKFVNSGTDKRCNKNYLNYSHSNLELSLVSDLSEDSAGTKQKQTKMPCRRCRRGVATVWHLCIQKMFGSRLQNFAMN